MKRKPAVLFVNLRRIKREGLESLLAARRLGYDVVMLAGDVPDFARPLVAEAVVVDTYDLEQSLAAARRLARRYPIHGVANWTEVDVQLVGHIARALGLPALPEQAARRARNKFLMKEALVSLDGVLPRFARVTDLPALREGIDSVGLPAIVKPTGASGSKGIFELHRPGDLAPAMERLDEIARPSFDPVFRQFGSEFIVEELLVGDEVSVEGFVAYGTVHVVGVTDKVTTEPFHLEVRHVFPSRLEPAAREQVERRAAAVVRTLGFDNCAFHLEGKMTAAGFRFIEVAARPAGDYIASHVLPAASGIDYFANVVRVAVGQELDLEPRESLHAGVRFVLAERAGRFAGIGGFERALERPGCDHVFVEVAPGIEIQLPPRHFGLQRLAAVIGRAPHYEAVTELLEHAASQLEPAIEPLETAA